ncbi:MAG: ABC transporter permease subunit, partial [Jatrophihabitantaceae bacterium]
PRLVSATGPDLNLDNPPRPVGRPRFGRRTNYAWLGLAPFFLYVLAFFVLPTGTVVFSAFRKTDPDTGVTSFTGSNVSSALHGVYLTGIENSLMLALVSGVIGALVGLLLAWAIVNSRGNLLTRFVSTAAAVLANFGGVPLAFLFIATVGNSGLLTRILANQFKINLHDSLHFDLYSLTGLELVYLYFQIPLMVLVITPALEGLKPQWQEAAANLGASRWQYWRHVGAPILAPNVLGASLLLFCSGFSAYATADALTSGAFPLTPLQIHAVLSGNVLAGLENLGDALAFIMVVIVVPLMVIYQLLQRRTTRWLR